jgi:hypothetical protein
MANENAMFGNENTSSVDTNVTPEEAMKLLVGEDAKYKTVEDMAAAMIHSQSHITKLEQENADLRDSSTKATSLADVLAAIKGTADDTNTDADDDHASADKQKAGSTELDISAKVEELLNQRAAQDTAAANFSRVKKTLAQKLGDRASDVYTSVGASLGVNLDDLSKQSPDAVIALVTGTPSQKQSPSTPSSTVNIGNESPSGELTYKNIQALYKEGKIKRHEKFKIENEQLSKLGREKFWS